MLFLYDLPNWLLGAAIIGTMVALSYAGYFAFHRLIPIQFPDDQKGLAMSVLGVVATVNSLLLAFSAVSVWEAFHDADAAVSSEANTIEALARDLAVFDSPTAVEARTVLRQYTRAVIDEEWPRMQRGEPSVETWNLFDDMFRTIARLELDTTKQETWMYEIFWRTNELLKERRTRLYTAQSRVPATLWAVVLMGTALSMLTTYVLPPVRFNVAMIGALALSIGLVFYFIIAMHRPFAGKESISPEPFQNAVENMDRWDVRSGSSEGSPAVLK